MKKALSLILALAMIASCVFALASCGKGGKYDGEYKYKSAKINKYEIAGQDFSEMFDAGDLLDMEDSNAAIVINGSKVQFKGDDMDDTEYSFTEKDGKLVLDKEALTELMGEIEEGVKGEVYFKVNGDDLDMYVSMSGEAEGVEAEIEMVISFKK